jgi:hypothetical protein
MVMGKLVILWGGVQRPPDPWEEGYQRLSCKGRIRRSESAVNKLW